MKAAEPPKVQAKPKVGPATSLGGADRHLVMRPFDARPAADFSIGPLVGAATDPGLLEALRALERGLREGELPLDRFSEGAAAISAVRFRESDLSGIRAIRFSIAGSTVRGTATVRVRALTEPGSTVSGSALGLAILTQNESGAWRIEHFELDTEALKLPSERKDPWDPYGVVFPSSTL
jgi:hypothetical protein